MDLLSGEKSSSVVIELGVHSGVAQDVRVLLPSGLLQPHVDLSSADLNNNGELRATVATLLKHQAVPAEKGKFILNCVQTMIAKFA